MEPDPKPDPNDEAPAAAPPLEAVIPALDAAAHIEAVIGALAAGRSRGLLGRVLVVDGGSSDATAECARRAGAEVIAAARGRGRQLAAGADGLDGDWLLFLHADTLLARGWVAAAAAFLADPANREKAAVFRLAFDDPSPAARRTARLANWRSRWLGLPYGDQGLLIARAFYRELGGFRPLALMEDVDLVRRIGRRRLVLLEARAVTSAARYRRGGWWARPLRNLVVLSLYFLGVPQGVLRRLYS